MRAGRSRDLAGSEAAAGKPGKVISYEEFLRARAAREEAGATPGGMQAGGSHAARSPEPEGEAVLPATFGPDAQPPPIMPEPGLGVDVRARRMEQVRARIREGYYEKPEVLEETVQRILSSMRPGSISPTQGGRET